MTGLFWGSVGLLAWTWLGYPAWLWLSARLRPPLRRPTPVSGEALPSLSVLLVAHDERSRAPEKLRELLALDYPPDRLEVVVASDGSTDGTVEALAPLARHPGVRLHAFPYRRGKAAVLNEVVPGLAGEVVVLVDARQRVEPGAARELARRFADPAVGAVSGELVLEGASGVGAYWRYEKAVRRLESETGLVLGLTGALSAVRRSAFQPLPEDAILDDVVLPLSLGARGYRVLFEPGARAHDRAATAAREYRRKVRTLAGNFQVLFSPRRYGGALHPRVAFRFLSHKALRLLAPLALAGALMGAALAEGAAYQAAFGAQCVLYVLAAAGALLGRAAPRACEAACAFVLLHAAVVAGLVGYLSGRQTVRWE
ncbi:MAG: glycosyltransferase family 2 protein [Planctomycetes bacterium]|nr:glycosyltransferase family 2 protein [Planctomycetota bacterium]